MTTASTTQTTTSAPELCAAIEAYARLETPACAAVRVAKLPRGSFARCACCGEVIYSYTPHTADICAIDGSDLVFFICEACDKKRS